jgi:20S proteasome subunit beta 3
MEINGGSVVAMMGKNCVAIASDLRLGRESIGVAHNFDKVSQLVLRMNAVSAYM